MKFTQAVIIGALFTLQYSFAADIETPATQPNELNSCPTTQTCVLVNIPPINGGHSQSGYRIQTCGNGFNCSEVGHRPGSIVYPCTAACVCTITDEECSP